MATKYHYVKDIINALKLQAEQVLSENVQLITNRVQEEDIKKKVVINFEYLGNSAPDYRFIGQDRRMENEINVNMEIAIFGNDEELIRDVLYEYMYIMYDVLTSTKERKTLGGLVDMISLGSSSTFDDDDHNYTVVGISTNLIIKCKNLESDYSKMT